MESFHDMLNDAMNFHWKKNLERTFQRMKITLRRNITSTQGASLVGISCVCFQMSKYGKRAVISLVCTTFANTDQKSV